MQLGRLSPMHLNDTKRSALDPPGRVRDLWARWLTAKGFNGSVQEQEQAYLESRGYDNWSDYLASLGYTGHINEQEREFWKDFAFTFGQPPTKLQRAVHFLAATNLGGWFIEKYLGMKGRIAA